MRERKIMRQRNRKKGVWRVKREGDSVRVGRRDRER
jgi:hypothetical protein